MLYVHELFQRYFNHETPEEITARILRLCAPIDCCIFFPPMTDEAAVKELQRFFLGKNAQPTSLDGTDYSDVAKSGSCVIHAPWF